MMPYNNIICLWATAWFGLWQRHQQVMTRLAVSHRILYVESPRDLSSIMKAWFRGQLNFKQLFGMKKVAGNIYLLSPVVPFSLRRYPRLNRVYLAILRLYIKFLMSRLGMRRPILWIFYPMAEYFSGKMGEAFACYDCCDDSTDVSPALARIINDHEARLLQKVKLVTVTSEALLREKKCIHDNVHLVPNGADFSHFVRAYREDLPYPPELKDIGKPIIGFIGSIQMWVDIDLIAKAAGLRQGWSWVLIGGVHTDISALKRLPNVYCLGEKKYKDLPTFLRYIDVCIVPFQQRRIVHAADPIKVYEYLSAGKPVVSTPIPRLDVFGDVIRIAKDDKEFIKEIDEALRENLEQTAVTRVTVARDHSWDSRVEEIRRLLHAEEPSD